MVLKTSKTQILDSNSIKRFCIVFYIAFYVSHFATHVNGEMKKGISPLRLCLNDSGYSIAAKIPAAQLITAGFTLSCSFIGFVHDILLYFFMKKKNTINKINPAINKDDNLIPWKSTNKSEDSGIPLRCTIISSITTVAFLCVSLYVLISFTNEPKISFGWYFVLSSMIHGTLKLPLVLIFTIKHKKKAVMSQPPQNLQFHEEENEPVS